MIWFGCTVNLTTNFSLFLKRTLDQIQHSALLLEICNRDGSTFIPKCIYKNEQWSPKYPEGKREYGRDFLVNLQLAPSSLKRPVMLKDEIIAKVSLF